MVYFSASFFSSIFPFFFSELILWAIYNVPIPWKHLVSSSFPFAFCSLSLLQNMAGEYYVFFSDFYDRRSPAKCGQFLQSYPVVPPATEHMVGHDEHRF